MPGVWITTARATPISLLCSGTMPALDVSTPSAPLRLPPITQAPAVGCEKGAVYCSRQVVSLGSVAGFQASFGGFVPAVDTGARCAVIHPQLARHPADKVGDALRALDP